MWSRLTKVVLVLFLVLQTGCASLPTNEELSLLSEQEFRVWVRDEVKSCRVQQTINTAIAVIGLGTGIVNMVSTLKIAHELKAGNAVVGP